MGAERPTKPAKSRGSSGSGPASAGSSARCRRSSRRGAVDFVLKPYSPETLARRLAPRLEERRQRAEEPDNQNSWTAGPRGPLLIQDYQLVE
ncbi:hypothetical protein ACIKTA_18655, partial [Hansschlegelia beijingensis]